MIQRAQRLEGAGRIERNSHASGGESFRSVERSTLSERCDLFVTRYERQRPTLTEIIDEAPTGLYSSQEIAQDMAYEKRLTDAIQQGTHSEREASRDKRARFAEAFLASRIVDERWFGADCEVFTTTSYDDIGNGVDFVLEWQSTQEDVEPFRLAVDVTTAQSSGVLDNKAWDIENSIRGVSGGKQGPKYLSEVRYYRSPHTDSIERLTVLPKVIMALEKEQVDSAMRLVDTRQSLTGAAQEKWVMSTIDELLAQLQQQSIMAMHEVCKKYQGFASLIDADTAAVLRSDIAEIEAGIRHASKTGAVRDVFATYDRFVVLADGLLSDIKTPDAYKDSVFVVHALVPVLARMYQTQLEQKKRFAVSRVDQDKTKRSPLLRTSS